MLSNHRESPPGRLGSSAFYILLALAQSSERHGADIAAAVEEMTNGDCRLMPGALYRYLKQMAIDGWIQEITGVGEDVRRKYYRLTSRGRRVAEAEARRLEDVLRLARSARLVRAYT